MEDVKGVRVLRIIEYRYESVERAEMDMARWTHSHIDAHMTMKTATLPFEAIEWSEDDDA